jgi:hypothetical protein
MTAAPQTQLIQATQLAAFFHDAVQAAAEQTHIAANAATLHYLASLLDGYTRSEQVFDFADNRLQLRPLALLYGEALEAGTPAERRLWLQRLGDLALFVGGLFAGRMHRRFQDLDYCMAMGGNAYGYLYDTATQRDDSAQAAVFGELSENFSGFVGLVAMVTGRSAPASGPARH